MKQAIVHDWLVTYAGAEKCLESLTTLYPESTLYTLIDTLPDEARKRLQYRDLKTSFLQSFPFIKRHYRNYLPLFPNAIESFDLKEYDLILSSSHAVAKNILTHAEQLHICYCHTPMRYAWDLYHTYLNDAGLTHGLKGALVKRVLHKMRLWDVVGTRGVDYFIANSKTVAKRIQKTYEKPAHIIYPPVDTKKFTLVESKEDYYLAASRFVPYKRMDLILEAFRTMPSKKLYMIGEGPEWKRLKALAPPNVTLLGYCDDETLKEYMQSAKAFVFAAYEDFGIIPVEAQACGTPVIALGAGGTSETIRDGVTGVLFEEQSIKAVCSAIEAFEEKYKQFIPMEIHTHAMQFSKQRYEEEMRVFIERCYRRFYHG